MKNKQVFNWILMIAMVSYLKGYGQNVIDQLTHDLQTHYENSDLPGFSVALVTEEKVLYIKGFGYQDIKEMEPFTPETILNLGSVSKTIVGLAFIKAIQDQKIQMDSPINDFTPFTVIHPYHKSTPILMQHLVTHTSGILDTKNYGKSYIYDGDGTEPSNVHKDFLEFVQSHPKISLERFLFNILNKDGKWYKKKNYLKAVPGTEQEYSNLNAALTAFVLEKAVDTPFQEYSRTKIFSPLGMYATTWELSEVPTENLSTRYFPQGTIVPKYSLITYPDGGLLSNTADMSSFVQELIKAFNGNSAYLPPKYAKQLLPGDNDTQRAFIGMGSKSRNIGHGGSDPGVQTDIQFNADNKIGRVILCNVNAEDNETLYTQYREIHNIVAKYEQQLVQIKK